MAITVPGADGDHGDPRVDGGQERRRRRGAAAVMSDLEHVGVR
jgi:hypothetical protein